MNLHLPLEEALVLYKYKTGLIYTLLSWLIFVNVRGFLGKHRIISSKYTQFKSF